jgi:N,N'-diacetyllegionaminate synthase
LWPKTILYALIAILPLNENVVFDDPKHTFVIAEAGSNWKCGTFDQDLNQAKQLIKTAAKAGCDAVKFQTFRSETVYAQNAGKSDYLSEVGYSKDINEIFANLAMPYEMIPELAKICKQENILFMSTPFAIEDAKHIDEFVPIHKLSSYEINHVRLLEYLSKTNKPLLISTGASTYKQIDFAVDLAKKMTEAKIGLMQCTAKYPCDLNSLNLSVIPKMISKYGLSVGLSDHSMDPILSPILAIGYGATFIEKHFTLDRNLSGPDHSFALIPSELELMVSSIRKADDAKGTGNKEILDVEQELWRFATRSIQATKNIKKGDVLKEGYNIDVLRPGNRTRGLDALMLNQVNGKKSTKDYLPGDGIVDFD